MEGWLVFAAAFPVAPAHAAVGGRWNPVDSATELQGFLGSMQPRSEVVRDLQ